MNNRYLKSKEKG